MSRPLREHPAEAGFYRLLLERAAVRGAYDRLIDIGSKTGSYFPLLADRFPRAELIGFECDGGRRYWSGHRRKDVADANVRALATRGVRAKVIYEPYTTDAHARLSSRPGYERELFTLFFPFVTPGPCRAWGLPERFSRYHELIAEILERDARPSLLSVHQGEWELEYALRAYEATGVQVRSVCVAVSEFPAGWPGRHPAWVITSAAAVGMHQ